MSLNDKPKLSPYWKRITAEAEVILRRRIEELDKKTVDPAFCLLPDDKYRMTRQQWDIDGLKENLDTVRKGGFWGKLAAFDAVLAERPGLIFRRN